MYYLFTCKFVRSLLPVFMIDLSAPRYQIPTLKCLIVRAPALKLLVCWVNVAPGRLPKTCDNLHSLVCVCSYCRLLMLFLFLLQTHYVLVFIFLVFVLVAVIMFLIFLFFSFILCFLLLADSLCSDVLIFFFLFLFV